MNATNSSTNQKRVAGGIVLGGKKKKKRRIFVAAAGASTSASNSNVPSILKSVPPRISSPPNVAAAAASNDDEFDELLMNNDDEIPNDVLLCLQSYTQSSLGMTAESSAYCPIFATNNDGRGDKVCTHTWHHFYPKMYYCTFLIRIHHRQECRQSKISNLWHPRIKYDCCNCMVLQSRPLIPHHHRHHHSEIQRLHLQSLVIMESQGYEEMGMMMTTLL